MLMHVSEDLVITGNWLNHMWAIRYNELLCITFKPLPHIKLYLVILGVKNSMNMQIIVTGNK